MSERFRKFFPQFLTLLSLFFGFSSILSSIQAVNDLYIGSYFSESFFEPNPQRFLALSGLFIFFSGILDLFDGLSARLLKSDSPFGAELDSLTDFVSFGIAPGVLFYTITLIAGEYIPGSGIYYNAQGLLPNFVLNQIYLLKPLAFLFPICTIIRLARFHVGHSSTHFKGMPSTYAGSVIGIVLTFNFYLTPISRLFDFSQLSPFWTEMILMTQRIFSNYFFILFCYIFFAFLMVSNVRFYRVDFLIKRFGVKVINPFLFCLFFISALYFKYFFVFFAGLYLSFSIVNDGIERFRKKYLDGK